MTMTDYNVHFNPLGHMTPEDFAHLTELKRLWMTRARFSGWAAEAVMGQAPTGFHYPKEPTEYRGYLVTSQPLDLQEATKIAGARGYNEEVVWIVESTAPLGYQPMQLFAN